MHHMIFIYMSLKCVISGCYGVIQGSFLEALIEGEHSGDWCYLLAHTSVMKNSSYLLIETKFD